MRTLTTALFLLITCLGSFAQELEIVEQLADTIPVKEYTPEELADIRQKHMDEMLPNTRALVFIDSLVVNKDEFLSQLRMTRQIGSFQLPDAIIPAERFEMQTGQMAFVNSLQNMAFFAVADSIGRLRLNSSFRNGSQWSEPQPIDELHGFDYQDYPFLCTDGSTLYFCASGLESIGGLDLFVTRYNEETRQYVRPQNLGFPYNSPANDYLLVIDEELGIGVLVSDRQQPDDKVCIYWFIAEEQRNIYDYDTDDEEAESIVRSLAAIDRIADTQEGHEDEIELYRKRWMAALKDDNVVKAAKHRFIIDDSTIYTSLDDFKHDEARAIAAKWLEAAAELAELEARQRQMRNAYAVSRDAALVATLQQLEAQLPKKRAHVHRLEKQFRAAEQ